MTLTLTDGAAKIQFMKSIAAVVISFGERETLIPAVRSLCRQDVAAEIVVVHSGSGDVESRLAAAELDVRVVLSEARLLPGGARNLGISSTRAPYVAFLADDCIAEPGWLRERLEAHEEGARAVASALLCHQPANPVALAEHLCLFVRRMPRTDPAVALRYGASYARALFDRHGLFREDLESGEDTEFHQRLEAADKPWWRPQVRTVHVGSETIGAFLKSQYRRGRRIAQTWRKMDAFTTGFVAKNAVKRTGLVISEALRMVEPQHRAATIRAIPFIAIGNLLYACGALTAGRRA
jgi:glycosyltransferase involved in cell wall biosynthesis